MLKIINEVSPFNLKSLQGDHQVRDNRFGSLCCFELLRWIAPDALLTSKNISWYAISSKHPTLPLWSILPSLLACSRVAQNGKYPKWS